MLMRLLKQFNIFFLIRFNFFIENFFLVLKRGGVFFIFMSDFYLIFWFSVALWSFFFNLNTIYFWNFVILLGNALPLSFMHINFFFLLFSDVTNFLLNFVIFFISSLKNVFNMLSMLQYTTLITNPLKDVDLTVNTDFEDLLAFLGDSLEFIEQDRAFFFDAIFDFYSVTGEFVSLVGLEMFILKNIKKLPQSATLAKFFYI